MGHCLKGYLGMLACTTATHNDVRQSLEFMATRHSALTRREQTHLAALEAWFAGDLRTACGLWDDILVDHPTDLLALRLQHFATFWTGKSMALRDGIARAWHAWDEQTPGYSYVLGMYAFGLEEAGDYAAAEARGKRAVELNPDDLWAIHAVAHVLEMQGRLHDGMAWLSYPCDVWDDRNAVTGRYQAAGRLLASLRDFAATPDNFAASTMTPVTLPMCESILAYGKSAYREAVAGLLPIRYDYACGGAAMPNAMSLHSFSSRPPSRPSAGHWPVPCWRNAWQCVLTVVAAGSSMPRHSTRSARQRALRQCGSRLRLCTRDSESFAGIP
jgi:hypothetical protein